MQTRMWIGCAVLAAAITGCGSSQERKVVVARTEQTAPPPRPMQAHDDMCAMMKVDPSTTQVSSEDTTDGVAVVFVTSGDPAALQERVQRMAEMHNKMATMRGDMKMVPSHATVETMDNGARMMIVPDDPSQLEALRDRVRMHSAIMARGECPMKGQMNAEHEHELEPSGT